MAFRRRVNATIVLRFNVNPKLLPEDALNLATALEIHVLPPANNGVPRVEIVLPAQAVDTWKLQAVLTSLQHIYEGEWLADAYATYAGSIVKIGRTVAWTTDPKYKSP